MKKIRKHIAGIIILSLVMVMGTKTFAAETKKGVNVDVICEKIEGDDGFCVDISDNNVMRDYARNYSDNSFWNKVLNIAKKAGIKEVPVIVKVLSDHEIAEISLIDNIQREDINPIEEALAYRKLKYRKSGPMILYQ